MNGRATKLMAEFIANTRYTDLSKEVVGETKRIILDAIGCMIGGYPTEIGKTAVGFVKKLGGKQQSTIMGLGKKTSCANAAYANGQMGNALDYDDTLLTPAHLGNPTVAAGLAVCEMLKSSGKELITSVAVGFEVGARVSAAIHMPFRTGTKSRLAGPTKDHLFGPTGAAAKALGQDVNTIGHTLSLAAVSCPISGYARWYDTLELPLFKATHHGWCAQTGISAALLANEGFTGIADIFDGDIGFWRMYGADRFDYDLFTGGLGQKWFLKDNTYKLWPACREPCYVLTALEEILAQRKLSAEEVEKIIVLTHAGVSPRHGNQEPKTLISAEFSIPHLVAMMVLGIPRGPQWYAPETRDNPVVAALRRKVVGGVLQSGQMGTDESTESGPWRKKPFSVEVITVKGEKFAAVVDYAKGDGWWAPARYQATNRDLEAKFREQASWPGPGLAKKPAKIEQSISLLWNLEKVDDISQLTAALSPTSSA